MKLYLLHNGDKVTLMAIPTATVTPEASLRANAKLRDFFNRGKSVVSLEVTIRPDALETIVKAITAFNDAPVPLVTALSLLLNFCRDAGGDAPVTGVVRSSVFAELHRW